MVFDEATGKFVPKKMTECQERLVRLFLQAKEKLGNVLSPGDAEPEMATFVNEVLHHPEERGFVGNIFKAELNSPSGMAWEFLQFCFHVLRWSEMQECVRALMIRDRNNLSRISVWGHLIESFDDVWSDAEFYKQFSGLN